MLSKVGLYRLILTQKTSDLLKSRAFLLISTKSRIKANNTTLHRLTCVIPMFKARLEAFSTPFRIFDDIQSVGNFLNFNICFNVWVVFGLVFEVRAFKQRPPYF